MEVRGKGRTEVKTSEEEDVPAVDVQGVCEVVSLWNCSVSVLSRVLRTYYGPTQRLVYPCPLGSATSRSASSAGQKVRFANPGPAHALDSSIAHAFVVLVGATVTL